MTIVAMLLAGGQGSRLSILSQRRAKPAVPFGGAYRIIDFTLSNAMHAAIPYIGICTQYKPASLMDHVGGGEAWGFTGRDRMCRILPPYTGEIDSDWYAGTADAVWQNRQFIARFHPDLVVVLSGDHIYKMDYRRMIELHLQRRADVTLAVQQVPWEETSRFGVMQLGEDGRVVRFQEKPKKEPISNLGSLGVYVFDAELLLRRLQEDAADPDSSHDFGKNIIPAMIAQDRVFGYEFDGFWRDVGTISSLMETNMESLDPASGLDLAAWQLRTNYFEPSSRNEVPALFGRSASVRNSVVPRGCVVNGRVENSILFPGVRVGSGASITNAIVMDNTFIAEDVVADNVIIDKSCVIDRASVIGCGPVVLNHEHPTMLDTGISVLGKGVKLPPGTKIGRNVLIFPGVSATDLPGSDIASGHTVNIRPETRRERG